MAVSTLCCCASRLSASCDFHRHFSYRTEFECRPVPTSPVVPTLSQPPEGVGDTKSRSKTTVSPTSLRGPNLLLHIHVGERKRSGTCFSIRIEKDSRWGHRGWDRIRSSHWYGMIKVCPNPLEGWDHAVGGWDRGVPGRFRFGADRPDATSCGDQSRRPTACEPSR